MPNENKDLVSPVVLITGSNRGVGLALVKEFLTRPNYRVLAACRNPSAKDNPLNHLKNEYKDRLIILRLDVNIPRSVTAAAETAFDQVDRIDILINNAGILPTHQQESLPHLDLALVQEAFETNAFGPLRVTREFLPLLRRSSHARIVNITSGAGSLSKQPVRVTNTGTNYAYNGSKAALNMFTRLMATDLSSAGISVVSITPGWVKTDMGGPDAELNVGDAATAIARTIENLTPSESSLWLDRDGKISEYAW